MVSIFRITHQISSDLNSLQDYLIPAPVQPTTAVDESGSGSTGAERVLVSGDGETVTTTTASGSATQARTVLSAGTASGGATSPFVINITYDASVSSAPAGFKTAITAAVQYLESQFSDAVTINIKVGYGEVNGQQLGAGALGESLTYLSSYSYTQLTAALRTDAKSATDTAAVASLPSSNPTGGSFWTSSAQAKALGLAGPSTATDGFVGFSATNAFDYTESDGITAGQYDFFGTALHELTEVMGRMMLTGGSIGGTANSNYLLDLLHYSAAGTHSYSASTPGYFSIDGGKTNLGGFNTVRGGDAGDWGSAMGNDAFNAFSSPGVVNGPSSADLTLLDAIGWDRAGVSAATISIALATDTGASSADRVTSNATLTGMAAANAVVTLTEGGTTLGTATATAKGAWTFTPASLTQGSHSIVATEVVSGQTVSNTFNFTYDSIAPGVTIGLVQDTGVSATDQITSNVALTGVTEPGSSVKLLEGTKVLGTVTANSQGVWSFTPTGLAVGIHKIVATTQDIAGNVGSATLTMAYAPAEATGTVVSQATKSLSGADSRGSLAAGLPFGSVTRVGGLSTDAYNYVLGGTSANLFKLTSSPDNSRVADGHGTSR